MCSCQVQHDPASGPQHGDPMPDVVFSKPATYNKRRQIIASVGVFPNCREIHIKETAAGSKRYDVFLPGRSATFVHGPTVQTATQTIIAIELPLKDAKAAARAYLERGTADDAA